MALKDSIDRLKSQLLTSGLQQKNSALYQVINQLIGINSELSARLEELTGGSGGGSVTTGQTILTLENEQATLPNSRRLNVQSGATMMTNGQQTFIGTSPISMDGDSEVEEGPMGPPGLQGPRGPAGSPASTPYWFGDNGDEFDETLPLLSLSNSSQWIPGTWTFGGGIVNIEGDGLGLINFKDRTAPADEKYWRFLSFGGQFIIQPINDAYTIGGQGIAMDRNGILTTSITFALNATIVTSWDVNGLLKHSAAFALSGRSAVSLAADQTAWNPSGLGTVFNFIVTPTAGGFTIRGITAQSDGTIIFIFNGSAANTFTISHDDAAASAADRIYLPAGINYLVPIYGAFVLKYDATLARWIALSRT